MSSTQISASALLGNEVQVDEPQGLKPPWTLLNRRALFAHRLEAKSLVECLEQVLRNLNVPSDRAGFARKCGGLRALASTKLFIDAPQVCFDRVLRQEQVSRDRLVGASFPDKP